jgi:hypothetical protein
MSIGNVKISADQGKNPDRLFVVVLCSWRYTDKIIDHKTHQTRLVLANQPCPNLTNKRPQWNP